MFLWFLKIFRRLLKRRVLKSVVLFLVDVGIIGVCNEWICLGELFVRYFWVNDSLKMW